MRKKNKKPFAGRPSSVCPAMETLNFPNRRAMLVTSRTCWIWTRQLFPATHYVLAAV